MKQTILRSFLALGALTLLSLAAQSADPPLSIASQGYIFAGGNYTTVNGQRLLTGQMYVEFQIPAKKTRTWPIVMVHGNYQSGSNFTGTPDGREGWAQYFLRQGYTVYVADQPGRARSAYQPELYGAARPARLENLVRFFTAPERYNLWPQAHLHTQWPGKGEPGDPVFDQFYASQLPSIQDAALTQKINREAIVALLDKIGPAILVTHSQSGAFGWPVADSRPNLVKAIVAVEPSGPPFFDLETGAGTTLESPVWSRYTQNLSRPWGITAEPLTYAPSAASASDLKRVEQVQADSPDATRCWLQAEPARQLTNLKGVPVLVMTSEASYHAPYDHCTVKYLQQAGVPAKWIRLGDVGIHGNGHMMMLERNNAEVAGVIARWLETAQSATRK